MTARASGAVDAHTHLDHPAFDGDRDAVVARARAAGVTALVIAGADPRAWDRVQRVAETIGAGWTLGVHPWWADTASEADLAALAARDTPHGLGETGLDHLRARSPDARDRQAAFTRAHLALARARRVPVVLHCVRAWPALRGLLEEEGVPPAGGMVHAWTGSAAQVPEALALGLHLSFGPDVLRSPRVLDAARRTPLTRLLLETDAPDRPARPGARGEPADLLVVAEAIATARGLPVSTVLAATADNARALFPSLPELRASGARGQ